MKKLDMDEPSSSRKGQILLVDDSSIFRGTLAMLLKMLDWDVREADGGLAAMELVRQSPPLAIVTDQRMPTLTGTQLHARLRSEGFCIPTVLISAAHDVQTEADGAGIRYCLQKPFEVEELDRMLQKALASKGGLDC